MKPPGHFFFLSSPDGQENTTGRTKAEAHAGKQCWQKTNRFFPLDLGDRTPVSHIYSIVNPSPMQGAALRTGDAKVSTGRALALLDICDQESGRHGKMPTFKPVAAMKEQNRFGVESIFDLE